MNVTRNGDAAGAGDEQHARRTRKRRGTCEFCIGRDDDAPREPLLFDGQLQLIAFRLAAGASRTHHEGVGANGATAHQQWSRQLGQRRGEAVPLSQSHREPGTFGPASLSVIVIHHDS